MSGDTSRVSSPVLLRTTTSAVLLDGRGDIELQREARGASVEWGGVYGQLVRLTGPWRLSLATPEGRFDLPATLESASHSGELFESRHRCGEVEVVQRIVPLGDAPGAVRTLALRHDAAEPVPAAVGSVLEPFLLPVLVEGIRPVSFDTAATDREVHVRHRGFALRLRSSVASSSWARDRTGWSGSPASGPVAELASAYDLTLEPGQEQELRFELLGGLERDLTVASGEKDRPIAEPLQVADALAREEGGWTASTPELSFPDAPALASGYRMARTALRRLYSRPGDGLTGLAAGFPWYAALWCRDIAWMIPALAWLGDLNWAADSLDSVLKFQSIADIPVVGGEAGELPMQIAPGPIFFYGTSDTTLYFPALAQRLRRHGLDPGRVAAWSEALQRAMAWGRKRTDPQTGLLRNGGEAAELAAATQSIGRVRYGIDAVDTTIWDSTDRRDHAVDLQVLWYQALAAAQELGLVDGGPEPFSVAADHLANSVRAYYPWAREGYLYDSIRGGIPVAKVRPNALRAVSAGLLPPELARSVVRRAAGDDLSAPWGVRTLSSLDPGYSPEAYHDGQVWPIATAWAADAAFAAGEPELGVSYLATVGQAMAAEQGQANECYRGDRPEPFNSCFLLGLSVGPFLTTLFEGLWGLSVDASLPALTVRPNFPPGWRRASVDRLRIGDGSADLRVEAGGLTVDWRGNRPLQLRTVVSAELVAPGGRARVELGVDRPGSP